MKFLKEINRFINNDAGKNAKDPFKNLFRTLSYIEKHAIEVFDFRDVVSSKGPNNKVLLTCEHASNNTHQFIFPPEQKEILNTHWGYDIGSRDMGLEIIEESKLMGVFSNFSRLLIDPNRSILSDTLIRKYVEKDIELEINKEDKLNAEERIKMFYMPYYYVLREVLHFIKPRYVISSHSFTAQYQDKPYRNFEIGLLYREKGLMADMIESAYRRHEINFRINEPYTPMEGVCHTMDSVQTWGWPDIKTETILFEFRNDMCSDPQFRKNQVKILAPIFEELNKH